MHFKEYDKGTLKRLQELELMILKDFIQLCEERGIDYFGVGGTAIGAVRHGGFIPWDDDIDIGMTRENYDKFLKAASGYRRDRYQIVNTDLDPEFPVPGMSRFTLKGTRFQDACFAGLKGKWGIFIDLYCFDRVPDDDRAMKRQGWKAWFWGKLLVLRSIKSPVLYVYGWKAKVVRGCCLLGHGVLKGLGISPAFLHRKAIKAAAGYRECKTERVAYFFDPTPFTSLLKLEQIEPTRIRSFEGIPMRFPGKIDAYLKPRYGNYMELPPKEKRHNHYPHCLDFGIYGAREEKGEKEDA